MKIRVNKSELAAALKAAGKTCNSHGNIPVLSNVKISAIDQRDSLFIVSTNLDQYTSIEVEANVNQGGEVLVPFRRFNSIIANLDGETVEIESEGSKTEIRAARFKASVQGVDIADWPDCSMRCDQSYSVEAKEISNAIQSVIGCVSADESRYILNGVFVECVDSVVSVVATDGRQLAVHSFEADWNDFDVVIPTLAADAILDACRVENTVDISFGEDAVGVTTNCTEIWSKTIAGKFPEWRRVMPDESAMRTFPAPHKKLLGILRRVGLIADPRIGCVRLDGSADGIDVSANNAGESASEKLECESPEFGVSVNHDFLAKMLATIDGELVDIKVGEDESPVLIQSDDLKYIIMPMRK
jgi:DNA polymerase III subunit beta